MVIFNVYVGCNNNQDRSFNISAEDDIEQVSLGSNAQYAVCNSNYLIMQEDALENKILGERHL